MTALTPTAREFHEQLADHYISQIQKNGVENPISYFERMNAFDDGRITDEESVRRLLAKNDFPLESFYRVAPTVDQDVMIATLNPGMQSSLTLSTFTNGEYGRQHAVGTDFEAKATTVATNLHGFLTHRDNQFSELIRILRNELDLMDSSGSLEEYVTCSEDSLLDSFFGDVCYTWMYKLATPNDGYINSTGALSKSEARQQFAKEIFDIVEPEVLVSVGKHGWVTIWEYLEENYSESPEELIEVRSENSPLTKSYNSMLGKGAYSGLYRVVPENLWVLTTWHASYWIKSGRLRENARRLNEKLQ